MTDAEPHTPIRVRGAREHNLRALDLDLERGRWTAVTGPSGSGKTSLVFDVLVKEGERRYLGALSTKARQFFGKLGRADVERVEGLPAPIAVARRSITNNPRSTVGTQSGVLDLLRLLFAREAAHPGRAALTRSTFSFNAPAGACEACGGLGVEDHVDPALLVADPAKTLRGGALVPTLPSGYTVYSQVTVDVMDEVCRAHGFDVDTPWRDLTDEQRGVVLYGSSRLEVPFGKHSLESRMRWEGITAKPREMGHYRGLVPVIEETLLRNRNPNVLRFVRSVPCSACGGSRLGAVGREARLPRGATLPELCARPAADLLASLKSVSDSAVFASIREGLEQRLSRMERLGLGHLAMARGSASLSGGEAQRLRLAAHLASGLGGALFALDEPTLGLHPSARAGMRDVLDELVGEGNTLLVVEHDPAFVEFADRVIGLGPGAGPDGGEVVLDTRDVRGALEVPPRPPRAPREGGVAARLTGATLHNLQGASIELTAGAIHVVVGPSGAGKSSLVFGTLLPALTGAPAGPHGHLETPCDARVLAVDARPMGRSSRSTPATWSGVFDAIRRRFAATDAAKAAGVKAGAFSFNGKAGRCPTCEGLGRVRVGLHLLEDAVSTCPDCGGARYAPDVLHVTLDGRTIADVLALTVDEAAEAFADDDRIAPTLRAMSDLGIGYLQLGAPSTTLSSGESQRIRLATLLASPAKRPTIYAFDEPDRGLHPGDLARLIAAYDRLTDAGHTVVAISHHPQLWAAADRIVEVQGGVASARTLAEVTDEPAPPPRPPRATPPASIRVRGARTRNLAGIDVDVPHGAVTAIVGPSGSGKSSLAFDTIAAEAWRRYAETLPFQVRRYVERLPRPDADSIDGLTPTIALRQEAPAPADRSTLATLSGLGPLLRLAWSRCADGATGLTAAHFRPDSGLAPCAQCAGRGVRTRASLEALLTDPAKPLPGGAMAGTKPGAHFTAPEGQHVATMRAATGDDLARPWRDLSAEVRRVVLEGAGDAEFDVVWTFESGGDDGEHRFTGRWEGLLALVEREAEKRVKQMSAAAWRAPLVEARCDACSGSGLAPQIASAAIAGLGYADALALGLDDLRAALAERARAGGALAALGPELDERLGDLTDMDLGALASRTPAREMSRADLQRVRLAGVLRSDLAGVTVVLDEPDAGLPSGAIAALGDRLRALAEGGATVVLVSHRRALIERADHAIALGPGAGPAGGRVVATGPPAEVGVLAPAHDISPITPGRGASIRSDALQADLPRAGAVALEGTAAERSAALAALREEFGGGDTFSAVIDGAAPVTATTPLHALDAMKHLQAHFAAAPESGDLPRAAFSYLSPKGRCPACGGRGVESVAMDFMADLALPCDACGGARYRPEVLDVRVAGANVAEVLATPAAALEIASKPLRRAAEALVAAGLGHVALGRATRTLSGGERQRLALAVALAKAPKDALVLLDEPAAGLADSDIAALVETLRALAKAGNLIVLASDRDVLTGAQSSFGTNSS